MSKAPKAARRKQSITRFVTVGGRTPEGKVLYALALQLYAEGKALRKLETLSGLLLSPRDMSGAHPGASVLIEK